MAGRIVVLISGGGSNMLALADACDAGLVPGEVAGVVSDRKCAGLDAARDRDIDTAVVEFAASDTRRSWSTALRDQVLDFNPDLVVSAGFMRIVSPVFVDAFKHRLINLHPALLPSFPGAHGVRDALEAGVKVTGPTVHFVDYEVDHGPIIAQAAVPVLESDDQRALHERIKDAEHKLLPAACAAILAGRVTIDGGRVRLS